jgi:hypothetical protein
VLSQEQPGDEKATDDKEDIDSNETAGRLLKNVIRDDGDDSERPQPLNVRPKTEGRSVGRGNRGDSSSGRCIYDNVLPASKLNDFQK